MSDLYVEIVNLTPFVAAMGSGPHILQEELQPAGRTIALRGAALSTNYVPVWMGNLKTSIYSRANPAGGGVEAIWGASAEYAMVQEKGRGAGKPMPPSGVMLPWMASKNIPAEMEFPVRRAIGAHGFKGRPFVGRAFNEIKSFAYEQFGAAIGRALKRIWG
jgi:hypothetical protein